MDESVLAALQRWPNVPAVYGWLSLDARGTWRLHPAGDGLEGGPGESITSPQIIAFIHRNYESDEHGNWFFQNGPQRVYVRVDAAPLILRLSGDNSGLETHTGHPVGSVRQWLLDDEGRLLADTEHGPAMLDSRDLAAALEQLHTADGTALIDCLEKEIDAPILVSGFGNRLQAAPLTRIASAEVPARMGFTSCPTPPATGEN